MDIYSLKTGKSESTNEIPDGHTVLRENSKVAQQESPSLKERVRKLEVGALYKRCTHKLIEICEEEQRVPKLISAVHDLVSVIASQQESPAAETFGVEEAAKKLGCSAGFVRTLVRTGKLQHHLVGKNLKFRQADLEAYWASQTRTGTDKKNGLKKVSGQKVETKQKEEKKSESPPVFPSREEIKKICRS
jgi:excisionase family DNA binding protein